MVMWIFNLEENGQTRFSILSSDNLIVYVAFLSIHMRNDAVFGNLFIKRPSVIVELTFAYKTQFIITFEYACP